MLNLFEEKDIKCDLGRIKPWLFTLHIPFKIVAQSLQIILIYKDNLRTLLSKTYSNHFPFWASIPKHLVCQAVISV